MRKILKFFLTATIFFLLLNISLAPLPGEPPVCPGGYNSQCSGGCTSYDKGSCESCAKSSGVCSGSCGEPTCTISGCYGDETCHLTWNGCEGNCTGVAYKVSCPGSCTPSPGASCINGTAHGSCKMPAPSCSKVCCCWDEKGQCLVSLYVPGCSQSNPEPPEPSCTTTNFCRYGDEVWRCESTSSSSCISGSGCSGWLYRVKDCTTLSQTGTCGNWQCSTCSGQSCKVKTRTDKVGTCQNAQCVAQNNTVNCATYNCPYGCETYQNVGDCKPRAVITSNPDLATLQAGIPASTPVDFSCNDSIEPECGNHTAANPSSCNFSSCTACSCSWTIKNAAGVTIHSTSSKQFTFNGFNAGGSYTVELKAYDETGTVYGTASTLVNVANSPPTACFTVMPSEGIVGTTEFQFDASCSSDPEGPIVSYEWDFGDGQTATGVTVKHTYKTSVSTTQTFNVKLVVKDTSNDMDEETKTVTVKNNPPVAKFSAVPLEGLAPLTVVFVANATDPDGHKIVSYEWDFGDGDTFTGGPEYIKKYTKPSTSPYIATLTVRDEFGAESIAYKMQILAYELHGIESVTATNAKVNGESMIYVKCSEATARGNVEVTIKHSSGQVFTTIYMPCNTYQSSGTLTTPGIYTVIARAPDCAGTAECTKTATFNVFEETPEVKTPEISFFLVVAIAFAALGIAKLKKK